MKLRSNWRNILITLIDPVVSAMAWLRELFSCHAEIAGSRGRPIWRSAAESGGCRPNRNFQPRRNGI